MTTEHPASSTQKHGHEASEQPSIFTEAEVRAASRMDVAIESGRRAFTATLDGGVINPPSWSLDMPAHHGEIHVKGAHLEGSEIFVVKAATGFEFNSRFNLPTSSGYSSVFDAKTGVLRAIFLDNGYLTELRTGAASALALDALTEPDIETITLIGTGEQARFQIDGILAVRTPRRIIVVGRDQSRTESFASWVRERTDIEIVSTTDREVAVRQADAIASATPSRTPLIEREWVRPGVHVTAVGSDAPWKRELDASLITAAALVVADDISQSRRLGELKDIEDAALRHPAITMGALLSNPERARIQADGGVTIADLSGLGAQDAAIAEATLAVLGV